MRLSHLFLLCLVAAGCECGSPAPVPVTLRLRNTTRAPVYVDATDATLGFRVQRRVGDTFQTFVDAPPCECLSCDSVCGGCVCETGQAEPRVQAVPAGAVIERQWGGAVQLEQQADCPSDIGELPACLEPEVPSADEVFRVALCYASHVPGVPPPSGDTVPAPVPGTLPAEGTVCVEREFAVRDGVVEVAPLPPEACATEADCGQGLLCFSGECTSACPPHEYPPVGGTWQVRVLAPEEQGVPGFFNTLREPGRVASLGAGTLTSVRYGFGTVTLQLSRAAQAGGEHKASLTVALPPEATVPLRVGELLEARVVDASSRSNPDNRALVLRDGEGALLLALDPAQLGPVLDSEGTAPVTVGALPGVVGCEDVPCGRRLFSRTGFQAGEASVALEPGEAGTLASGGLTWRVLNVTNSAYVSTSCALQSLGPYVVARQRETVP